MVSELIRNRSLEIIFLFFVRLERNAVTFCDVWKIVTRFGIKRSSVLTVIIRCSLSVLISVCDGMSSIGSLAVLSCN